MNHHWISPILIVCFSISPLWANACCAEKTHDPNLPEKTAVTEDESPLQPIFSKMNEVAKNLKSCQGRIVFTTIQDPDLLNSTTRRNGILYFSKDLDKRDRLRIQFVDIKQDDFETEKQREEYLFDGVWLTRINFKLEQIDLYQKAPEDAPIGIFELIENNFPIIGFSGAERLEKDFQIQLAESDPNASSFHLILLPKKASKFDGEYTKIEFWVDKDTYLPDKIVSYSAQGDIYHVQFQEIQINKKLEKKVFTIETPDSFRENREPLKAPEQKGS